MHASGSTRRKLRPTRPDGAWRRNEGPPLASNTAGGTTQPAPEDPSLEGTARPPRLVRACEADSSRPFVDQILTGTHETSARRLVAMTGWHRAALAATLGRPARRPAHRGPGLPVHGRVAGRPRGLLAVRAGRPVPCRASRSGDAGPALDRRAARRADRRPHRPRDRSTHSTPGRSSGRRSCTRPSTSTRASRCCATCSSTGS